MIKKVSGHFVKRFFLSPLEADPATGHRRWTINPNSCDSLRENQKPKTKNPKKQKPGGPGKRFFLKPKKNVFFETQKKELRPIPSKVQGSSSRFRFASSKFQAPSSKFQPMAHRCDVEAARRGGFVSALNFIPPKPLIPYQSFAFSPRLPFRLPCAPGGGSAAALNFVLPKPLILHRSFAFFLPRAPIPVFLPPELPESFRSPAFPCLAPCRRRRGAGGGRAAPPAPPGRTFERAALAPPVRNFWHRRCERRPGGAGGTAHPPPAPCRRRRGARQGKARDRKDSGGSGGRKTG